MADPIAVAAALGRLVYRKRVERSRKVYRLCPRCHKRFPDPQSPARR